MEQYSIYEGFMDDLQKKVNRIQNKCRKFGCEFTFNQVGEEFKEVKVAEDPETGKDIYGIRKFIIVEAEGTAQLNDWEFIASVEHTEKGNIFSKAMTAVEIPARYRCMDPTCEHCNSNRMRKSTFIVHNTVTDEFKMVGNSCLMDFTHGLSVSTASWFASLKRVFQEAEETPVGSGGGWHTRYFETETCLKYIAETIRHFGFAKSEDPNSTRQLFQNLMDVRNHNTFWFEPKEVRRLENLMIDVGFNPESEEAKEMVKNAIDWLEGQEAKNDYMHNLKVACSLEYTNPSNFGLLVSLFPTYDRNLELEAQRKKEQEEGKLSEYVGKVGDRVKVEVASTKCITSWETQFGWTYIWKIVGADGNIFTWKTSNWINEEHQPKTITGTVKEHKTFREVKQTELTRCRMN